MKDSHVNDKNLSPRTPCQHKPQPAHQQPPISLTVPTLSPPPPPQQQQQPQPQPMLQLPTPVPTTTTTATATRIIPRQAPPSSQMMGQPPSTMTRTRTAASASARATTTTAAAAVGRQHEHQQQQQQQQQPSQQSQRQQPQQPTFVIDDDDEEADDDQDVVVVAAAAAGFGRGGGGGGCDASTITNDCSASYTMDLEEPFFARDVAEHRDHPRVGGFEDEPDDDKKRPYHQQRDQQHQQSSMSTMPPPPPLLLQSGPQQHGQQQRQRRQRPQRTDERSVQSTETQSTTTSSRRRQYVLSAADIAICERLDLEFDKALEEREIAYTARFYSVRQSACFSIVFMAIYMTLGTIFFLQQADWNVLDSVLFSVYTITTVGYGHLEHPETVAFQLYTIFFIFIGIASLTIVVAQVYQWFALEASRAQHARDQSDLVRRGGNNGDGVLTRSQVAPPPEYQHHQQQPSATAFLNRIRNAFRTTILGNGSTVGGASSITTTTSAENDPSNSRTIPPPTTVLRQHTSDDSIVLDTQQPSRTIKGRLLECGWHCYERCKIFFTTHEVGRGLSVLVPFAGLILIGAVVIGPIEGWSVVESVYFSVVSLTTVGFGDYYPTRMASTVFCILWLPFSVGFMSLFLANVAAFYIRLSDKNIERIEKQLRRQVHRAKQQAERERNAIRRRVRRGGQPFRATTTTSKLPGGGKHTLIATAQSKDDGNDDDNNDNDNDEFISDSEDGAAIELRNTTQGRSKNHKKKNESSQQTSRRDNDNNNNNVELYGSDTSSTSSKRLRRLPVVVPKGFDTLPTEEHDDNDDVDDEEARHRVGVGVGPTSIARKGRRQRHRRDLDDGLRGRNGGPPGQRPPRGYDYGGSGSGGSSGKNRGRQRQHHHHPSSPRNRREAIQINYDQALTPAEGPPSSPDRYESNSDSSSSNEDEEENDDNNRDDQGGSLKNRPRESTMSTMRDVLRAVRMNMAAQQQQEEHQRQQQQYFPSAGPESEFLSIRSSQPIQKPRAAMSNIITDLSQTIRKPSFALRALVQERFSEIIATDVAGYSSNIEISDNTLSITIDSLKQTADKWLVPRRARRAFRAVTFEALLFVGEHGLITRGADALYDLSPFEFHGLFAPLLAAMGDAETMEGWLSSTQVLAEVDLVVASNDDDFDSVVVEGRGSSGSTNPRQQQHQQQRPGSLVSHFVDPISPRGHKRVVTIDGGSSGGGRSGVGASSAASAIGGGGSGLSPRVTPGSAFAAANRSVQYG